MEDDQKPTFEDITGLTQSLKTSDAYASLELQNLTEQYNRTDDPDIRNRLYEQIKLRLKAATGTMCGLLVTMTLALLPAQVSAQAFTNADFLKMPEIQQKGYLDGAVQTLYQMAAQKNVEAGQCVHDWYYGGKRAERNWLILRSMEKYPDNFPAAIIAALTERACGRYIRREQESNQTNRVQG